jgi:hypothetical protein
MGTNLIGSSKRVYPESGIKPIALNAILDVLTSEGLTFNINILGQAGTPTKTLFSLTKW